MGLPCVVSSFPTPQLFGAEFLSIQANLVTGYNFDIPEGWRYSQPSENVVNATFCNVTVTYTHPGQNDEINVEAWLPVTGWNGILQSLGGGGWVAGRFILTYAGMAGAIADGYASVTTDAGLGSSLEPTWSVISPGNLDLYDLENLGLVSLNDEAIIAKQLIQSFYGQAPSYSYFNGCSQGGRQASMLAQQYPDVYDGIIAAAPGVHWAEFSMSTIWPIFYMDLTSQYPSPCELKQITTLAIGVCDALDGHLDGLIADPEACRAKFNPFHYVGTTFNCTDTDTAASISLAAADVANATWSGPRFSDDTFMWYGYEIGSDLTVLAPTSCNGSICVGTGDINILGFYDFFVAKDLSANITKLTHAEFDFMYRRMKQVFASSMATHERDLTVFRDAGGKMITYHGLADQAIPPENSLSYYKDVTAYNKNTLDFYRYFRVPGLQHCWGGDGGQPVSLFKQLRAWRENGTAPEQSPVTVTLPHNSTQQQILCVYPKKPTFRTTCRNSNSIECWSCSG